MYPAAPYVDVRQSTWQRAVDKEHNTYPDTYQVGLSGPLQLVNKQTNWLIKRAYSYSPRSFIY